MLILVTVRAYLIKKINVKTNEDEMIIEKILEKSPSFSLKNEKILTIFENNNFTNLNDDLNGEISIDKYSWLKILEDIDYGDFTQKDCLIFEKISNDLSDNDVVYYECL